MKKFLGTAMSLALLYSAALPANAELLKNLKLDGNIQVQGRSVSNQTDLNSDVGDFEGQIGTRMMLGLTSDLTDDVSARVGIVKNDRLHGTGGQSLTAIEGLLLVEEANITAKGLLWMDHTVGRQYYGDPGDLLIRFGPSQDHVLGLPVSALDAWRADWKNEHMRVTALLSKFDETTTFGDVTTVADDDIDIRGVEVTCTKKPALNLVGRLYEATVNSSAVAAPTANRSTYVLDLMAKGSMDVASTLSYKVEVSKNFGDSAVVAGGSGGVAAAKGLALLGNAKYETDIKGAGKAKVMLEYATGSGDDDATDDDDGTYRSISSDYRPGLIWGGLSEAAGTVLSANNGAGLSGATAGVPGTGTEGLTTYNLGVYFSPERADKLWLGLHLYSFALTAGAGREQGKEVDFTATWKQSDNVKLRLGYAFFMPGDGLAPVAPDDNIKMGTADLVVRF